MKTSRWTWALVWILGGCGAAERSASFDRYNGPIDGAALDAKFLPGKCGSQPCYAGLTAQAQGRPVSFYLLGTMTTSSLPPLLAENAPLAYHLPDGDCVANDDYDSMRDAYRSDAQFPLFTTLPFAARAGVTVLPFVNVVELGHLGELRCNAAKTAESVGVDGQIGRLGLAADTSARTTKLWAVIDPTAPLSPSRPDSALTVSYGWYRGLLLTYLDGGQVPVSASGELQAMDGVILDPPSASTFAKPNDPKVLLLPYRPGEAGYSPIVKLHSFRVPEGRKAGDYSGICLSGVDCRPTEVNFTEAAPAAFNTILIAAQ
jgi:hypothetical protein